TRNLDSVFVGRIVLVDLICFILRNLTVKLTAIGETHTKFVILGLSRIDALLLKEVIESLARLKAERLRKLLKRLRLRINFLTINRPDHKSQRTLTTLTLRATARLRHFKFNALSSCGKINCHLNLLINLRTIL